MKAYVICFLGAALTMAGCHANDKNNHEDAVQSAKDSNSAKMDSAHMDSTGANGTAMRDDAGFMVDACAGGKMEVTLGKLAEQKSQNDRVKAFGQMMVKDHTDAGDKLKAVADQDNITLPSNLSDKQQKEVTDLSSKQGADFDRAYMHMMVKDHKDDIKEFQDESNGGKDPGIKALATNTLPMLSRHLDSAQAIEQSLQP